MSAALPRYRSETSFGLPSAQPISRRYQYGFPLITFLYRLATALGHRIIARSSQGDTPDWCRPGPIPGTHQPIKINLARKLGLAAVAAAFGVRRHSVTLVTGATSRTKIIDVPGADPATLTRLLAAE